MSTFTDVLYDFTAKWEGGISNDPDDDGGLTSHGVTQATWDRWCRKKGMPSKPVTMSTAQEREQLYFEEFWQAAGCYKLSNRVAKVLFDTAVNPGVDRAIHLLQAALGVEADGMFGPKTLRAAQAVTEVELCRRLVNARKGYYVARVFAARTNRKFLRGWLRRCDALLFEVNAHEES